MFTVYRHLMQLNRWDFRETDLFRFNPFFVEGIFWVLVAALAGLFLFWTPRWMKRLEGAFCSFARRKTLVVVGAAVLVVVLRLGSMPWNPKPIPFFHDEFSYLLQTQTFDAGRLTNPTHPMWVHFEGFHINMRPTYQSMYPVGQATFLLVGQKLFGDPWFGVLISVALMCAAAAWMLQGWMPPAWALFGALIVVARFGVYGDWINSYWGGAVAATGGCLLLGALGRLRHHSHGVRNALLFAAGLALLANTRPFEGFVFSLIPLGWLSVWLYREFRKNRVQAFKVIAAGLLVLVPVFSFMLYYNYVSTGDPLLLPYAINHRTYHISKPFIWQERYPFPAYHHFMMKKFYVFHELPDYLNSRQPGGIQKLLSIKVEYYYLYFLWPLGVPLIFSAWFAAKSRRWRLTFFALAATFTALLVQMWPPHGHYAAPAMCIVIAFLVLSFRLVRTIRVRGAHVGVAVSRAVALAFLGMGAVWYMGNVLNLENLPPYLMRIPPDVERARIASELSRMPGKHLVIMRWHLTSGAAFDFVYNEPDIDRSKVVWARDMGDYWNQELLDYFRDRQLWEVDVDKRRLVPYQPPSFYPPQALATMKDFEPSGSRLGHDGTLRAVARSPR